MRTIATVGAIGASLALLVSVACGGGAMTPEKCSEEARKIQREGEKVTASDRSDDWNRKEYSKLEREYEDLLERCEDVWAARAR